MARSVARERVVRVLLGASTGKLARRELVRNGTENEEVPSRALWRIGVVTGNVCGQRSRRRGYKEGVNG